MLDGYAMQHGHHLNILVKIMHLFGHDHALGLHQAQMVRQLYVHLVCYQFCNNDSRVDEIAVDLVERFMTKLRSHKTYRNSEHTMSVLTITSNVVYGKKTGNTPDNFINTTVIITIFREVAFDFKVSYKTFFVTDRFNLCIFNR
jgi:hypothetical protein